MKGYYLLASTCLFVATPCMAQTVQTTSATPDATNTAIDANNDGSQEIIVTARQRSENLQRVPIAVNVLTGDDLAKRDIHLASDLQNVTPGLVINGAFGATNPQIFIRGVGNNDYNDNAGSAVGVYLDGVFLNSPSGKLLQMYDLENVQILKGPQGTLFGKNNTAGAIIFTTKKPGHELEGYATATVGNYGVREIEGGITVPLTRTVSIRVSGTRKVSDGWGENRDAHNRPVQSIGGVDEYAGRFILRWQHAGTDVSIDVNHASANDDRIPGRAYGASPAGTDVLGFKNPSDDIRVSYSNFPEREKAKATGIFVNASHDFGPVTLASTTAWWNTSRFASLDSDKSPNDLLHLTRSPRVRQFSQELRLSSDSNDRFKWVAGVNYFIENLMVNNRFGFGVFEPNLIQDYTNRSLTKAVFAEATVKLNDMFSLTAGARYSIDDRGFIMNFLPFGIVDQRRSRSDKLGAGRLILDQRITDDVMLYYSVSRGFQGGGFNGGAFSLAEIGAGYKPETLTAYEFGWKTSLLDRRARFNGAIFYYDYRDIQLFSLSSDGVGNVVQKINNASKGRLFGMEADVQVTLSSRLKVGTGVNMLSTRYLDPTLGLFGYGGVLYSAYNKPFISAPVFNMTAYADHQVPIGDYALSTHVDAMHTSSRNFDPTGRAMVSGGAYTLMNVKIGVGPQDQRWSASLWAKNILGARYKSFVADLSGIIGSYETFFGAPATYGVQLGVRF